MRTTLPKSATSLAPALNSFLNKLQERKSRTSADRELARRVRATLEGANLDVRGLSVYVHDGSIAVYGSIRSESTRESLLSLVADQPGARRITDHLQLLQS